MQSQLSWQDDNKKESLIQIQTFAEATRREIQQANREIVVLSLADSMNMCSLNGRLLLRIKELDAVRQEMLSLGEERLGTAK
eukprot:Skav210063  [mRNA]  locus=scaffold485:72493:73371:+ [translate_table: standard]